MGNKISIIGAGSVGASIAYTMAIESIASEIVLVDINEAKARGEALDILQATAYGSPITISHGQYADVAGSDIVIISSGVGRKPGQSRIDLAQINVNILKGLTKELVAYAPNAKYIIVANPVDILTYTFMKVSGLPECQVIGSGTMLDTARLRSYISGHYEMAQKNVHAYVFGEHGDSSFIPWSLAEISGASLEVFENSSIYSDVAKIDKDDAIEYVQKSGGKIIADKGVTCYGVAVSVCRMCQAILSPYDSVAAVSSMMHGEYGIEDVCLSVLNVIGPDGFKGRLETPLTDDEVAKLRHSADVLKEVINSLEI